MKKLLWSAAALAALAATSASAAPLSPADLRPQVGAGIEQVRLVCNEYGRCFRTRGPRYVQRYGYGDGGYVRRGYVDGGPRYYGGNSYGYGGGPSIGFSFGGGRGW